MYIRNRSQLFLSELDENQRILRKIGLNVIEKAIFAVKPERLMKSSIKVMKKTLIINEKEFNLEEFNNIYIIGGGKAVAEMAFTLESFLSQIENIEYNGIINIPQKYLNNERKKKSKIFINFASHPIPNEQGLNGTKSMIQLIEQSKKNDLIFCLISGGGSALLPLPKKGITIRDLQILNSLLLECGASIHEINTIRKHVSDFKGGNLAKKVYNSGGATLITLILSDVVGDNLDSIASGPTAPDLTTFEDALIVLKKYNITEKVPSSIKEHLIKGRLNKGLENPDPGDQCFNNVYNFIIGSIKSAIEKITLFLKKKGFEVDYFSNKITGEAREYGGTLSKIIPRKIQENINITRLALIGTGELTVTLQGKGIGGRNQEMLLSFLDHVKKSDFNYNFLITGVNLDGIEGNSEAMGALIDNYTLYQSNSKNLDSKKYLDNNDSNTFFKLLNTEIISGPTGCNVNDLLLILILK